MAYWLWPLLLFLCGCVTSSYNLEKVSRDLNLAMIKSDGVIEKASNDQHEKQTLVENLEKMNSPQYQQVQTLIKASMSKMEISMTEVQTARKKMIDAKADVASLSYGRSTVKNDEKNYDLIENALKTFESSTKDVNDHLLDYSRESNSVADLVEQKKLFYNFDVGAYQTRIKQDIRQAQDNQLTMNRELEKATSALNNWNKPELRERQEQLLSEMQSLAESYSERAKSLNQTSKELHELTMGNARVSSLNPEWPHIQQLLKATGDHELDLNSLNDQFQKKANLFRNPSIPIN